MTTTKEPASTATGKLSLAEILAVFPAAPRSHYGSLPTTAVVPESKTPCWGWTC